MSCERLYSLAGEEIPDDGHAARSSPHTTEGVLLIGVECADMSLSADTRRIGKSVGNGSCGHAADRETVPCIVKDGKAICAKGKSFQRVSCTCVDITQILPIVHRIPEADRSVARGGRKEGVVGTEGHANDPVGMSCERCDALAIEGIPDACDIFSCARGNPAAISAYRKIHRSGR